MSSAVQNILTQLVSGFGQDAVRQACLKFCVTSGKGKKGAAVASDSDAESVSNGKKEKKTRAARGPNSWTLFVSEVLAEMKAASPDEKITRKMAMAEAGRRKRAEAGPEAEEKYQAAKAKKAEKKAEKKASKSSPETSDAEEEAEDEAPESEKEEEEKPVKKPAKKVVKKA
jgi:hypothetical protein